MDNIIGIDVSKDTLDFHRLTDGQHKQFNNVGAVGLIIRRCAAVQA